MNDFDFTTPCLFDASPKIVTKYDHYKFDRQFEKTAHDFRATFKI